MRLLVTGGAGFIGSNFVRYSIANRPEASVTVLDALTYAGRTQNLDGLEGRFSFVHGDVRDAELLDRLVEKCDLVVHFAAETHNDNSLRDPRPFFETNVLGSFEIAQACRYHGVRLHHISTDEVFGDLPLEGDERFTLMSPYNPSSPYSASKAAADFLVRAWVRSYGLNATISNCSNNFGPYQHEEKLIPSTILRALSGIPPIVYGEGKNIRDWIHVDDHSSAVWAILDRGLAGETYLIGANMPISNLQVVQTILKLLHLPEDFVEFVADRPGHDLRYSIDGSSAEKLGWAAKHTDFEGALEKVVAHYTSEFALGRISL